MKALGITAASQGPKGVGWAFAASLVVHGVALAAIVWGFGTSSQPVGVQIMDVELVVASPGEPASGTGETAAAPAPVAPAAPAPAPEAEPSPSSAPAQSVSPPAVAEPRAEFPAGKGNPTTDIPVQLPDPDPPPPVQAGDWRVRPPPASAPVASAPAAPPGESPPPTATAPAPSPPAAPPRAASPPRPTTMPAPKRAEAAPTQAPAAPTVQAGGGPNQDSPSAGGGPAGGGARLVRHVAPAYPALARERGLEGRVVVRLVIGADGVPGEIRIAQGSGVESLDAAAIDAVRQWRFEPARRAGIAVPEERLAPVVFRLRR